MKKNLYPLFLTLLFLSGCSLTETGLPDQPSVTLGVSTGTVSTKTWLDGNNEGDSLPVYWSDGDRINVNGHKSLPVIVPEGEAISHADFTVRGAQAPYSVVYPADICAADWEGNGPVTITIPKTQEYSSSSFGNGSAILYGYSENEHVQLKNLCGALLISLIGEDTDIVQASLISSGKPITGAFKLDPADGSLEVIEGGNVINLLSGTQTLSTAKPVPFYFAVPAGEYPDGFQILFTNSEGRPMTCNWLRMNKTAQPGVTVTAGMLTDFGTVEFMPEGREVISAEDWKTIVESIAQGQTAWEKQFLFDGTTIRLGADITLEEDLTIDSFKYILDAQGHSITRASAENPLFGTLSGTVKDLVLVGSFTGNTAPLAATLSGGKISGVINRMTYDSVLDNQDVRVGGLVQSIQTGVVSDCVNEGAITINAKGETGKFDSIIGGLAATVDGSVIIERCSNKAAITISINPVSLTTGYIHSSFGGLVGLAQSGTATFTDCSNDGMISLTTVENPSQNPVRQYSVGGILGVCAIFEASGDVTANPVDANPASVSFENCSNSGIIRNYGVCSSASNQSGGRVCSGGIAGTLFGSSTVAASLKNCTSVGEITPNTNFFGRNAFGGVIGGLVGYANAYFDNCENTGDVTCAPAGGFAGGLIGSHGSNVNEPVIEHKGCKVNCKVDGDAVKVIRISVADVVLGKFRYAPKSDFAQTAVAFGTEDSPFTISGGAAELPVVGQPFGHIVECLAAKAFWYGDKKYPLVKLDDGRWWMAAPLAYVPEGKTVSSDPVEDAGIWYTYTVDNKVAVPSTDNKDGYLYDYPTAMGKAAADITFKTQAEWQEGNYRDFEGAQGICPPGWYIPTRADFLKLVGNSNKDDTRGEDSAVDDPSAIYYVAACKGSSVKRFNEAGWNFSFLGARNKTSNTATGAYNVTVTDNTKCSVPEWIGKPALNQIMSSTAYKPNATGTSFQYFCMMSTFTSAYMDGRLSLSYAQYLQGVEVRCIRQVPEAK